MNLDLFLKTIGRNLALCRKDKSILQTQAADQSGISYRYYQTIESGKANMTLSTLLRLAQYYDVHPCKLMDDHGVIK